MKNLVAIIAIAIAIAAIPAHSQIPIQVAPAVKIGVVNLETIATEATDGKAATAKIQALAKSKQAIDAENVTKLKALERLAPAAQSQALANERFRQDAQAEIDALQNQLQAEFQKKLLPVLSALAQEKGLQILLSFKDSGIIWGDKSIDLTKDAIAKMDATK